MARNRYHNRRRRGRGGFLYKLLSMILICAAIIAAMTLFFRVEAIEISGQVRYRESEIYEAAAVETGENLYLLNKHEVANRIIEALPYIETVRINRKLPSTLVIEVQECGEPVAVLQEDGVWLISIQGKIVERKEMVLESDYVLVSGMELLSPSVGTRMAVAVEKEPQQESLLALLKELEACGMLGDTDRIRMEDPESLYIDYADRFTIKLGYHVDYEYKLRALQAALADSKIQQNMTGTFDLQLDDSRIFFRQNVR